MMTNTRIYGYYMGDGYAVCPSCFDPDGNDDHKLPGDEGAYPLYSLDDDGEGMTCDDCGGFIFERPTTWETDEVVRWIDNDEYLHSTVPDIARLMVSTRMLLEDHVKDYLSGQDGFEDFAWHQVDWNYVVTYGRT